ncbi:hypothetical protein BJ742DRAFT_743647 [Cladochytrium replicatum]|nr:hypothetical protein BJ742DRAFT_743647 [Cladochytrium replicatum]
MHPQTLPIELIDEILILLGLWIGRANSAYKISVFLRRNQVQFALAPYITLPSMDEASRRGLVRVLDLHLTSRRPCVYSPLAMDWASYAGHIDVLEWWKSSGLELKYSEWALDQASESGNVEILQWWKDSGLELRTNGFEMYRATVHGRVNVLQWWRESGISWERQEYAKSIEEAYALGHKDAVLWWAEVDAEEGRALRRQAVILLKERTRIALRTKRSQDLKETGSKMIAWLQRLAPRSQRAKLLQTSFFYDGGSGQTMQLTTQAFTAIDVLDWWKSIDLTELD